MSRIQPTGQIISGHHVRVGLQPVIVSDKPADGSPVVHLKREGGRIKEIHVRCGCGELLVLDCEYDPPAPVAAQPRPVPAR